MKLLILMILMFGFSLVQAEKGVSKVSQASPVFVACDMDKEKPLIKEGVWFKYDQGQLYLAKKNKSNKIQLSKITGDCTIEPNFIRN